MNVSKGKREAGNEEEREREREREREKERERERKERERNRERKEPLKDRRMATRRAHRPLAFN